MPHACTWNIGVIGMYTSPRWKRWPDAAVPRAASPPCRVEGRGPRVLVEVPEVVLRGARGEQFLVLGRQGQRARRQEVRVGQEDKRLHGLDPILDLLEHGQEVTVSEQD